jgi:hypothetical protein
MTPLRQRFIEDMQLRGLAPTTQRSYLHYVSEFSKNLQHQPGTLRGLRQAGYTSTSLRYQHCGVEAKANRAAFSECGLIRPGLRHSPILNGVARHLIEM